MVGFLFSAFFALLVDFPANKLAALKFFETKFLNLERLIFPLDDVMLAGANFRALDKLDVDTPKMVATSLALREEGEPWSKAAWILLETMALTSATVFASERERDVVDPVGTAVFELVPLEVPILLMFSRFLLPAALMAFLTA